MIDCSCDAVRRTCNGRCWPWTQLCRFPRSRDREQGRCAPAPRPAPSSRPFRRTTHAWGHHLASVVDKRLTVTAAARGSTARPPARGRGARRHDDGLRHASKGRCARTHAETLPGTGVGVTLAQRNRVMPSTTASAIVALLKDKFYYCAINPSLLRLLLPAACLGEFIQPCEFTVTRLATHQQLAASQKLCLNPPTCPQAARA